MKHESRRGFLKKLLSWGLPLVGGGLALGNKSYDSRSSRVPSHSRSRVVIGQRENLLMADDQVNKELLKALLHEGLMKLTGKATPDSAWASLFSPQDVVGIKVNTIAGRNLSTHPELVEAIVEGLRWAGLKDEAIIIWDRQSQELQKAGFLFSLHGSELRCLGTDAMAEGYDSEPELVGSVGSCFSKILSRLCTAIINVPVLKDHDLAGVSLSMKNYYGAIHNPNKYHDNQCDPYVADLNTHPYIKEKQRLIICDGLVAQYNGGPGYKPWWSWKWQGLLFSFDPVAHDIVGAQIIEEKRKEKGMAPLKEAGKEPKYIRTAAELGLGKVAEADIERIVI